MSYYSLDNSIANSNPFERKGLKKVVNTTVTETITVKKPEAQSTGNDSKQVKGVGDVVETNSTVSAAGSDKAVKEDIETLKRAIHAHCKEAGISFPQLMVNLSAIFGGTLNDFYKLKPEVQKMFLNYVDDSIQKVKNANRKDVDSLEAVTTDTQMMYHFMTHDKNKKVVLDFNTATPEEIRNRRQYVDTKFKEYKDKKLAKINKLNGAEKEAAIKELEEGMADIRKHVYNEVKAKVSLECAMENLLFLASRDVADEAEKLLDSLLIEKRIEIANTAYSWDKFKEYIQAEQGRGTQKDDKIAYAAWKKLNALMTSYMTKNKFNEYQAASFESRQNGELPTEVYKATEKGIGEGAYANHVMTAEEKQEAVQTWVKYNDGFLSDTEMAEVEENANKYIDEYLEKHPEEKESFARLKQGTMKETVEKTLERKFKPEIKKEEGKQSNTEKKVSVEEPEFEKPSKAAVYTDNRAVPQPVNPSDKAPAGAKKAANKSTLQLELKTAPVSELKEKYTNSPLEYVSIVLRNDNDLGNRVEEILPDMKGLPAQVIGMMLIGCSTTTIKTVTDAFPDKKDGIMKMVEPYVCAAGKTILENNKANKEESAEKFSYLG